MTPIILFRNALLIGFAATVGALLGAVLIGLAVGLGFSLLMQMI